MSEDKERTIRDIYDVIKALHEHNIRGLRYWGKDRCCCCGDIRHDFSILCKQCESFWNSGNFHDDGSPLADIYWSLTDRVVKFPSFEEFCVKFSDKIELAIPHIGERMIGIRIRGELSECSFCSSKSTHFIYFQSPYRSYPLCDDHTAFLEMIWVGE